MKIGARLLLEKRTIQYSRNRMNFGMADPDDVFCITP